MPLGERYAFPIDARIGTSFPRTNDFNWYNASVFSHDIVIVAANHQVAEPYLFEFDQILRRLRIFW